MAKRTKRCKVCDAVKSLDEMTPCRSNGKTYYRSRCLECERERKRKWADAHREQTLARQRRKRADDPAWAAWRDSKYRDSRLGLEHDLSREDVAEILDNACSYCGETVLRMTLDRIDNGEVDRGARVQT